MKKVILQLGPGENSKLAGKALGTLSGVMVTDVQGDSLVVHCGERLDANTLIKKLNESGCTASVDTESRNSFF